MKGLDAALELGSKGYRVFPVKPDKRPLVKQWPDLASTGRADIEAMWRGRETSAVGIATGGNLVVLDPDVKGGIDGIANWTDWAIDNGVYWGATTSTPSGGIHVYFHTVEGDWFTNRDPDLGGVDVRGEGGYVVSYGPLPPLAELPKRPDAVARLLSSTPKPAPVSTYGGPAWDQLSPSQQSATKSWAEYQVEVVLDELKATSTWERYDRNEKGYGWEKITADAAWSLRTLVTEGWSGLTTDDLEARFFEAAPDLSIAREKWYSQDGRETSGGPRIEPPPFSVVDGEVVMDSKKTLTLYDQRLEYHRANRDALRALDAEDAAKRDSPLQVLNLAELDNLPTPEPLIAGVINRHTYSILRGRDATFKSFIALDWALHLATGKPWQGNTVERVKVLYIAAEGAYGLRERAHSWQAVYGDVDPDRFHVVPSPVNMYAPGKAFDVLLETVSGGGFGLVIVDTLRKVSGGADENGSDMGRIVDSLDAIKRATDHGSVVAIAHTGKADEDSRGFSGIEDDADTVWHAKREAEGSTVRLTCKKMKDGPDGHFLDLMLSPQGSSLVIGEQSSAIPAEFEPSAEDLMMDAMTELFPQTGATLSELRTASGVTQTTAYKARKALLDSGKLVLKGQRLYLGLKG